MESESKIGVILSPVATASMALLLVLSLLEYARPGFASLFLDFRVVAAVALGLWIIATLAGGARGRSIGGTVLIVLSLVAFVPILYRLTTTYGRLGVITFVAGLFTFIIIFISTWTASSAKS
jgi:hypothetical protein